jgi:hypothetical protein
MITMINYLNTPIGEAVLLLAREMRMEEEIKKVICPHNRVKQFNDKYADCCECFKTISIDEYTKRIDNDVPGIITFLDGTIKYQARGV